MVNNEQQNVIKAEAEALIAKAEAAGVVLTIGLKALEPLAMGNHKMVVETSLKHPY